MNDPKQILVERDTHVVRVTINRPERDQALCDAFAAACNRSEDYREGQRAFAERCSPDFRGR